MSKLDLQNGIIKNSRGLVYKVENGQRFFLLTQELDGIYTLPGGCKDLDDVDSLSAMQREIKEELNLNTTDYEIRGSDIQKTYQNVYPDPTSERFGKDTIICLFLIQCIDSQSIKLSDDIKSFQWFNEIDALKSLTTNHMKEMFRLGMELLQK
ncbi:MAG: NUDIX domain-containing protein [Patescibacteria group bacterium]|jgi:8-oxo-dGTP pyrophosphatase MutT (NUDIX family)